MITKYGEDIKRINDFKRHPRKPYSVQVWDKFGEFIDVKRFSRREDRDALYNKLIAG